MNFLSSTDFFKQHRNERKKVFKGYKKAYIFIFLDLSSVMMPVN